MKRYYWLDAETTGLLILPGIALNNDLNNLVHEILVARVVTCQLKTMNK